MAPGSPAEPLTNTKERIRAVPISLLAAVGAGVVNCEDALIEDVKYVAAVSLKEIVEPIEKLNNPPNSLT